MASMKQIKKRKRTVESTGKITKAMKLVATVKLQKTKQIATDAVPFFDAMYEKITGIIKRSNVVSHKYIKGNPSGKKAIVVFSSNKGLAGGYNSSIVKKLVGEEAPIKFTPADTLVYAYMEDIKYGPYVLLANKILDDFAAGKINEIYLVYTYFKNTIVHIPRVLKLLPFENVEKNVDDDTELLGKKTFVVAKSKYDDDMTMPMNYEMDEEEMLNEMIPQYISTLLYGALTASIASENGARMTAMDNATKNAKELSEKLGVMYNRARQGAITQELTEIVAGANAI